MINIRNTLREIGGFRKFIANWDFLYDNTNNPDYWCSSIKDFRDNETLIKERRTFELPRVQYFPLDENQFELKDPTGTLTTQMYINGKEFDSRLESFFERLLGDPVRKKFSNMANEGFMYGVCFKKNKGGVYVLDFETHGPSSLDKSEKDYLALRFPHLAPALIGV